MNKFNDTPFLDETRVKIEEFDTIEINNFANSLFGFISDCETPMTIGLQGDWGSGKTSLMNMVKCKINKKYHKIDLNTWHYSMFRQDDYLGITIIKALVDKLIKSFENDTNTVKALNVAKNILNIGFKSALAFAKSVELGVPGVSAKIGDVVENIKSANESNKEIQIENLAEALLNFKQEFIKLIQENVVSKGERIYFFIDDLDRIKPIKAIEVLEALKNFLDVEGCIFILAVDYEIVQLGISEKFGSDIQKSSGKSFFDKIIQLPFSMPLSSYNIEKFVIDLIKSSKLWNYDITNDKEKEFFLTITESTIGRNPRSIKRAINYAVLLEKIRATHAKKNKEENTTKTKEAVKLLYAIVCLQIAWPELFEHFIMNPTTDTIKNLENWDFLEKLPHAKRLFERINNQDEVRENISIYFDTLYSIIDTDRSGEISEKELEPVLTILKLTKLTSATSISRSEDQLNNFTLNLKAHCLVWNIETFNFFDKIFLKSKFKDIEYKKAGYGYVTIVFNRKQIGSLVSLKTRPLIIRIKENADKIISMLSADIDKELYKNIVKKMDRSGETTGIGDTIIDYNELIKINDDGKSKEILNNIFDILTKNL